MRLISAFALFTLVASSAVGAPSTAPTLEERMAQSDFREAGLEKLSPTELAHLNQWLQVHGEGTIKYVGTNGKQAFYPDSTARAAVEDRIAGTFSGWRGDTVFKLDNGQEWKQAESGRFSTTVMTHPKVRIKPMLLGSWLMYVDGCGCDLRVDRIR
ncbi:MAG: hypothetical protein ABI748_05300 [Dokdonella sp.]